MNFPFPTLPVRVSLDVLSRPKIRFDPGHRFLRSVSLAAATVGIVFLAACAGTTPNPGNPGGGQTSLPATPAGLTATAGNAKSS